jgi:hypothetical protein
MTVRLRAHHLLCMLTYVGRGYSDAFTARFDEVVRRLGEGEEALLVRGPDDVCAPLLEASGEPHCHRESVLRRDEVAAASLQTLLGVGLQPGARLRLDEPTLTHLRSAFRAGHTRSACSGCEWFGLCSDIAQAEFAGTRLQIHPAPGGRT